MKNIKFLKRLIIIFILILFIVSSFIGGVYYVDNNYTSNSEKTYSLTISKGESISSISNKLKQNNIILSTVLFKVYGKYYNMSPGIKYGTYEVNSNMSYLEIYKCISVALADTSNNIKITIPEGYTVNQIADVLSDKGIVDKDEFLDLCKTGDFDYPFLQDIPIPYVGYKLEGFLFPDTYFFEKKLTCTQVISIFLDNFEKNISQYIDSEKLNMYDVLKVASIVERESATGPERPIIAGVFYNRLNKNIKLESCATVEYVLNTRKRVLSAEDIAIDSPFNTYLYDGLPLTPISNPGKESLEASFNPEKTDYLYFVSKKGTNVHAFGKTYEEHLYNVKKFRD